jgi:hypothetical protein
MSKVLPLIGFLVEKNLLFVLCCKNLPGKCRLDGQHGGTPRVQPRSFCGYFCEKAKTTFIVVVCSTFTRYMFKFCSLKNRKGKKENKNKKVYKISVLRCELLFI